MADAATSANSPRESILGSEVSSQMSETLILDRPIRRLDVAVINRIAAGEILQRPANALKELLENALDAGATMIRITLSNGGVRMLQVQDNGSGINRSDLELLCERFATSKLRTVADLSHMATFGFRGEALASLSYAAARVTVTTKTAGSEVGYRATYSDGQMQAAPKVSAATNGTSIQAEDLFYNQPHRRRALGSDADEYHRCLDVASKYAVQFGGRGVGVVCKRSGSNTVDLSSPSDPKTDTRDVIQLLYGKQVARELVPLCGTGSSEGPQFSVEGWVSGANWSGKKTVFLCFINDRLVDCPALRRTLEALYAPLLPRGGHPWMYVSLTIAPEALDVNVHPSKQTVHFVDEDAVIEAVAAHAATALSPPDEQNRSRSFRFTQLQLPGLEEPTTPRTQTKTQPRHLVRTDANAQTLEGFFRTQAGSGESVDGQGEIPSDPVAPTMPSSDPAETCATERPRKRARTGWVSIRESECDLASIASFRMDLQQAAHKTFTEIIQHHTFVGVVDTVRSLSLIQHKTELYLINHSHVISEFGYQLVLRQFGAFERVNFDPPLSLASLAAAGIAQDASFPTHLDPDEIARKVCTKLLDHRDLLDEYFGIQISTPDPVSSFSSSPRSTSGPRCESSPTGQLLSLPALLPLPPGAEGDWQRRLAGHGIQPGQIPSLVVRLAAQVDWTEEEACLSGVAREIGRACVPPRAQVGEAGQGQGAQQKEADGDLRIWATQHVWFPAMHARRGAYLPSVHVQPSSVFKVAAMSDLYRVFERC